MTIIYSNNMEIIPKYKKTISFPNVFENTEIQTVMVCDGLTYSNNAGSIVRQCSIFGCNNIFFCPLDKKRLHEIDSNLNDRPVKNISNSENVESVENAFHTYQLKNIYNDPKNGIRYTNSFKKSIKKFSVGHNDYVNIFYDIPINDVIEQGLKNDFIIFRLENKNKNKLNNIFNTNLSSKKIMFIVGNECEGVSDYVMENSSIIDLYIPSKIPLDSLNVANVAIITCYERFRQINQSNIDSV